MPLRHAGRIVHQHHGIFFWPWLADRVGRRGLLALNIALFSLMMPVVVLSTTFAAFVAARAVVGFALKGEWALGSLLVAETWPARLRGRVIGINRGTCCRERSSSSYSPFMDCG
jgi:MFS family permease